jgi:hypothetical protein
LNKEIADGKKLPRWKPKSERVIFVGISDKHIGSTPIVLNPRTRVTTTPYHVVFDDWFATVSSTPEQLSDFKSPEWQQLFGDSEWQFVQDETWEQPPNLTHEESLMFDRREQIADRLSQQHLPPMPTPSWDINSWPRAPPAAPPAPATTAPPTPATTLPVTVEQRENSAQGPTPATTAAVPRTSRIPAPRAPILSQPAPQMAPIQEEQQPQQMFPPVDDNESVGAPADSSVRTTGPPAEVTVQAPAPAPAPVQGHSDRWFRGKGSKTQRDLQELQAASLDLDGPRTRRATQPLEYGLDHMKKKALPRARERRFQQKKKAAAANANNLTVSGDWVTKDECSYHLPLVNLVHVFMLLEEPIDPVAYKASKSDPDTMTLEQALRDTENYDKWITAIEKEIRDLEEHGTWEEVPVEDAQGDIIPTHWVMKIK